MLILISYELDILRSPRSQLNNFRARFVLQKVVRSQNLIEICIFSILFRTEIPPGLYMNAFCYTLQDDILSDYEQCLVELEEEIMMDTDIALTYIQSKLQEYTLLFPTLILLLEEIQRRKVHSLEGKISMKCMKSTCICIVFPLASVY